MWASKLANKIQKVIQPPSWWSVVVAGVALIVIMGTVVTDVTMRKALGKTIQGNIDIVVLMLLVVFFGAVAYCELKRRHIQVDVLVGRFPSRVQQIINTNGYFLITGGIIILSSVIFTQAVNLHGGNVWTAVLHIPVWPFVALAGFFLVLFVGALVVSFLNELSKLVTMEGTKAYLWLLPGIAIALGIFLFSYQPDLMPIKLTRGVWGGLLIGFLFLLIFLRVHIGVALVVICLLGLSYLSGPSAGLRNLVTATLRVSGNYTWSVLPLFMWMGLIAFHTGFAEELYRTIYKWIGHIPGGLASASTAACTVLAAIVGDTFTGVLTMGTLALPQMRAYKYDMKLATASICVASTIGVLIPPSIGFIIYGMITEQSIGKLFIAGIIPGILFTAMLVGLITMRSTMNPKLGPRGPWTPWKEKIISLKDVWAVILLIIIVLGGIYAGFFTPTEAGAIGAFGALVISLARRRLTFKGFTASVSEAVQMTAVLFFIFIYANALGGFLAPTRLPQDLAAWVAGLGLSQYAIMACILFVYMILGCLMNSMPAVILTLPIFYPIAMTAGFDPIHFGVLIVVMVELGVVTPPIGMNVFAMSAIAKDVPMYDIFKGILPFWATFIVLITILVVFPQISLFLPNLMMR